jgi:uncharacterized coiled-coil DUF342 family protein
MVIISDEEKLKKLEVKVAKNRVKIDELTNDRDFFESKIVSFNAQNKELLASIDRLKEETTRFINIIYAYRQALLKIMEVYDEIDKKYLKEREGEAIKVIPDIKVLYTLGNKQLKEVLYAEIKESEKLVFQQTDDDYLQKRFQEIESLEPYVMHFSVIEVMKELLYLLK